MGEIGPKNYQSHTFSVRCTAGWHLCGNASLKTVSDLWQPQVEIVIYV
jgi:hypothetical protein